MTKAKTQILTDRKKLMEKENLEWRTINRKNILHTRVMDVIEQTSISPDGTEYTYIVEDSVDWAIVIPVYEDNFLMVKQWRHGERELSLEFPGGDIDEGENVEEGAKRELLEEAGVIAKKITHLMTINPNPALNNNHVHIYCAEDLTLTGTQSLDKDEFLNCEKVPIKEVYEKMGTGMHNHALMAAALFAYIRYKNEIPAAK